MAQAKRHFAPIDFRTRLPALDGLRALAVTLVFADHYGGGSHGGGLLQFINLVRQRGWMGVDLFFVLSGFLITGILYDTRDDSHFFRRFFARRALRVFPVFYIVVVLLLALTPIVHYHWQWLQLTFLIYLGNFFGNASFSLYELPSTLHPAATVSLGHFWSLCVEEQFYLVWPAVVWYIRDRTRLLWTAAGVSLLALALRLAMLSHLPANVAETWILRTLPFRVDGLLIGAMLALLLRGPDADRWQRAGKLFFLAGSALTLAIFILSPAYDSPWLLSIGVSFIALAGAGLLCATLRTGSAAFKVFYWKPLRILGRYSYGFYVYHLLFRTAWIRLLTVLGAHLHSLAAAGAIALAVNFGVTFFLSMLSYNLIEVRWLGLKPRFEYDLELAAHKHAFVTK